VNAQEDIKYFGLMNTYPVLDVLWKANLREFIPRVNKTMSTIVRMPYTNNWRIADQVIMKLIFNP